jgi:hypothetical protein
MSFNWQDLILMDEHWRTLMLLLMEIFHQPQGQTITLPVTSDAEDKVRVTLLEAASRISRNVEVLLIPGKRRDEDAMR